MREIVLDTETTGLDPEKGGHRLVEIGCVELFNRVPTGKVYHTYLNPERDMPEEAFRVHNLSDDFLKDKPLFSETAEDFLAFIQQDTLVIHNAAFDLKFLNFELKLLNQPIIPMTRAVDTVLMARKKFPGSPANLDALCSRFKIDRSRRTFHGALLDAQLLADVYLELLGGAQMRLSISKTSEKKAGNASLISTTKPYQPPRPHAPTPDERANHLESMKSLKSNLWTLYQ